METVIVEFTASNDDTEACVAALETLMRDVVSKHPDFHGANVLVEQDTGTVINVMRWTKASDFVQFRDSNQEIIAPALGKFAPLGRMFSIAVEF